MSHHSSDVSAVSRRSFLALTGGLGAAVAGLAGCDTGYRDRSGAEGTFHIPDPRKSLPSKDVTFRLVDSGDTKKPFWDAFFEAYQKKHQNVTVKYDGMLVNRMDEAIPLGIRNGTAHDVFQLPPSITIQKAVAEGWVAPFDDLVPDVEAWKKKFPDGTFAEGQQIYAGKLYMVPLGTEQRHFCLLHYNKQLMDEAGYDPAEKPLTVDEYRDAARKMTKKIDQVYGVVLEIGQPNRLTSSVEYMARKAGLGIDTGDGIDGRTGEFFFTKPEVLEAIDVVLALRKDGSLFPGSNSLSAPEAWPRVVRGGAGMVSGGPWVAAQWQNDNPDFEFGVADHPTPVEDPLPLGYTRFGSDSVCIYAKSELKGGGRRRAVVRAQRRRPDPLGRDRQLREPADLREGQSDGRQGLHRRGEAVRGDRRRDGRQPAAGCREPRCRAGQPGAENAGGGGLRRGHPGDHGRRGDEPEEGARRPGR
ncbi:MAG: extracellular solute-binding protein [Streptosporangiales bacterium]|nr:extracellular solute-binding protein [Streptosporangiales bacterium]